jgi:hypothetical protein
VCDSAVRIRKVILGNENTNPGVTGTQGDDKMDDAREAPTKNHLGVPAHVNPAVDGSFFSSSFEGEVMGEPVLPFSGPVGLE